MTRDKDDKIAKLRAKAKSILEGSPDRMRQADLEQFDKIVEELQIHQVELEIQNEELREAQIELERQRDRYSRLYNQAPVGYLTIDDSGIVIDLNSTFADMLRKDSARIRNVPLSKFVHADDHGIYFAMLKSLGRQSGRTMAEVRLTRYGGACFHARLEAKQATLGGVCDEKEKKAGRCHLVTASDITPQKEAEQKQKFQAALLDSVRESVIATDMAGNVTFWGKGAQDLYGYRESEVMGKPVTFIVEKEEGREEEKRMRHVLRRGKWRGRYWQRRKDGSRFLADTSISLARDDRGKAIGLIGIDIDITEQEKARLELKESRERVVRILESVSDGFMALDKDLTITYFNKAAESLLDRKCDEVLGRPLLEAFPEAKDSVFEENFRKAIASRQPVSFETYFKVPPYENWYDVRIFPYENGISVFFQVTTERKDLETHLRQAHKMEAIGTLAGGIAHDFNNILGIILGNVDLAIDDIPSVSDAREHMDEIRIACLRAKEVVRQLLKFSRSGEEDRKTIDILPIVKESVRLLRASIPATIDIESEIRLESAPVSADPTQLHQVLINLCTNAFHAISDKGAKGKIEIGVEKVVPDPDGRSKGCPMTDGPCICLSVADDGVGIAPELIERIFDPYFTTKDVGKGTGMGLSVVLGIVKNHGGRVSVESTPGCGSTFRVFFPMAKTAAVQEPVIDDGIPGGNESVLFIDDEQAIATMGKKILERFGYHAEVMTDPVKALEIFRQDPDRFDLVVSDMTMPGMRGDFFAEELFSIRPGMPLILCTGYNEAIDEVRAAAIGVRHYLEKPLSMQRLLTSVRNALDRK